MARHAAFRGRGPCVEPYAAAREVVDLFVRCLRAGGSWAAHRMSVGTRSRTTASAAAGAATVSRGTRTAVLWCDAQAPAPAASQSRLRSVSGSTARYLQRASPDAFEGAL